MICVLLAALSFVMCSASAELADQIVYPMLLESRSQSDDMKALRIRKDLVLNLQPGKVLSRDLMLTTLEDGVRSEQIIDSRLIENYLYKDPENGASLLVRESGDNVQVNGIVNPQLGIRALPIEGRHSSGPRAHMLFRMSEINTEDEYEGGDTELHLRRRSDDADKKGAKELPAEVNPEVHVIGDEMHVRGFARYFDNSNVSYVEYVCILLNGANLIFESAFDPKIQINLVGVTMIKDNTTDILEIKDGVVLGKETLETKFQNFVQNNVTNMTDMIYLLTGHDVNGTYRQFNNSRFATGEALQDGLCQFPNNTAIGEDGPGSYAGFSTMANMLAILMGAIPGGASKYPDNKSCEVKEYAWYATGFYLNISERMYNLTNCTQAWMRKVLTERGEKCWNVSQAFIETPDKLPGSNISDTDYCHRLEMFYNRTLDPCPTIQQQKACLMQCCDKPHRQSVLRQAPDKKTCPNGVCYKGQCTGWARYTRRTTSTTTRPPRR